MEPSEHAKDQRDWSFIHDEQTHRDRSDVEFWTLLAGICIAVGGFVVWGGFAQTGTSDDPPMFPGSAVAGAVLVGVGVTLVLLSAWSHFRKR